MGFWMDTKVDTEILMHYMAFYTKKSMEISQEGNKPEMFDVVEKIMKKFDGAYNVVSMFADGELLAFRDPRGFHPLFLGENEKMYAIASESSALDSIGIEKYEIILPGEAVKINGNGLERKRLMIEPERLCHFEAVYFMRADSKLNGLEVRAMRNNLGRRLAREEPLRGRLDNEYLVVPAPKAAIPAAEGFANELGLKYSMAIDKAEDLRGFINDSEERKDIMSTVYIIYESDIRGKKIILIDDSIVRGETSKQLISDLRKKGALEVHLRLTEPPIKHPCWYGIDYPTRKELIANLSKENLEEEIAKTIGADSVHFQTLDGMVEALGIPRDNLCLACLTGKYPTHHGQKKADNHQ
jgi:amidophosphoribosyltransferase